MRGRERSSGQVSLFHHFNTRRPVHRREKLQTQRPAEMRKGWSKMEKKKNPEKWWRFTVSTQTVGKTPGMISLPSVFDSIRSFVSVVILNEKQRGNSWSQSRSWIFEGHRVTVKDVQDKKTSSWSSSKGLDPEDRSVASGAQLKRSLRLLNQSNGSTANWEPEVGRSCWAAALVFQPPLHPPPPPPHTQC